MAAHLAALAAAAGVLQSPELYQGRGKPLSDFTDGDGSPFWPAAEWLESQSTLGPATVE